MSDEGASKEQQLLYGRESYPFLAAKCLLNVLVAARTDNEELLLEIFQHPGAFDINCRDGLGNTRENAFPISQSPFTEEFALHVAVSNGSTTNLEHILSHDECDVDPQNKLEHATPLHLALALEGHELRLHVVQSLLEAGADTRIKNKHGDTVLDLVGAKDEQLRQAIRKAQAESSISHDDIAHDDDDGDDTGSASD